MREEQEEGNDKQSEDAEFEGDFLANGCEKYFHRVKVFSCVDGRALKISEGR